MKFRMTVTLNRSSLMLKSRVTFKVYVEDDLAAEVENDVKLKLTLRLELDSR